MKNILGIVLVCLVGAGSLAHSADKILHMDLNAGISAYQKSKGYSADIEHYFAGQSAASETQLIETKDITLRSSRAADIKVDQDAPLEQRFAKVCNYIFSAVLAKMNQHAVEIGANAIINIVSYWNQEPFESDSEFICARGGFHSAVTLRGDFVTW